MTLAKYIAQHTLTLKQTDAILKKIAQSLEAITPPVAIHSSPAKTQAYLRLSYEYTTYLAWQKMYNMCFESCDLIGTKPIPLEHQQALDIFTQTYEYLLTQCT